MDKVMRPRISIGISGLDNFIGGGRQQNRFFLVSGETVTGKTIFCLQYILAEVAGGENAINYSLYIGG